MVQEKIVCVAMVDASSRYQIVRMESCYFAWNQYAKSVLDKLIISCSSSINFMSCPTSTQVRLCSWTLVRKRAQSRIHCAFRGSMRWLGSKVILTRLPRTSKTLSLRWTHRPMEVFGCPQQATLFIVLGSPSLLESLSRLPQKHQAMLQMP